MTPVEKSLPNHEGCRGNSCKAAPAVALDPWYGVLLHYWQVEGRFGAIFAASVQVHPSAPVGNLESLEPLLKRWAAFVVGPLQESLH